jgi:hypothetical protein
VKPDLFTIPNLFTNPGLVRSKDLFVSVEPCSNPDPCKLLNLAPGRDKLIEFFSYKSVFDGRFKICISGGIYNLTRLGNGKHVTLVLVIVIHRLNSPTAS